MFVRLNIMLWLFVDYIIGIDELFVYFGDCNFGIIVFDYGVDIVIVDWIWL